ncbi:hypothetical protein BOO86_04140 [Mycobacterium sp. CBMA 234]|uniref:helix-turn-helix domain-containing protein n=1 Tax=Mycolicibacterium sp. CBMA 234 TaxID=1918495 RepID=UPI0012DE3EA6|nr:helix-turn-helix domain-containing protein [Mycolicibacterium sp. CBMA 234]MUL63643.1 hypothetical protein [Mycolicibacterium sp. CBMA 234]
MSRGTPLEDSARAGSPPTERVVSIVELLAGQSEPSSVASIASRLDLNRATVTSILLALERAGWVVRLADRNYTLGPGMLGVAEAVRNALPMPASYAEVLRDLAHTTKCGVSLALVGTTEMTFVSVIRGLGQIPAGVGVGVRLPLNAPAGASVIAGRDSATQQQWLATAPEELRPTFSKMLDQLGSNSVATFGFGDSNPEVLGVLGDVAELLSEHPRRGALRQRVFETLMSLGGMPYTAEQLDTSKPLPVSYLSCAVRNADGYAAYEIQLGPLNPSVSAADRARYVDELRAAAAKLSSN